MTLTTKRDCGISACMHTILTMWFTIVLALSVHMVASELCPGGSTSCARGMTCCELPSGEEGCCPFDNATCCPDKVHCCPNGYDCLSGHCQHASESIYTELSKLMVEYQEPTNRLDDESHQSPNASLMVPANLICPDGHVCRDLGTCCEISENEYGCCPYQDGVCCQNHRTCCPSLYTCSFGGWCVVTIQDNTLAPVKGMSINTICPGGRQTCPAGDTCCPHGYQQWGCCPLLAATCCSDQTHCCPHGYRCNGQGFCTKVDNEN